MQSKKPSRSRTQRSRRSRLTPKRGAALNFERLEARQLMATLVVGNASDLTNGNTNSIAALIANDGGDGISLREAAIASNNTNGADLITFAPEVFTGAAASVIRLTQGELTINDTVTIDGTTGTSIVITADADNNDATVSGSAITDVGASLSANASSLDDNSRVINFSDADGTLTLSNLTLTGGRTTGENGGGVYATLGHVELIGSTVIGNSVSGDLSNGGGVFSYSGDVSLLKSTVSGNSTSGYSGYGGGIYAFSGNVALTNSTVADNTTLGDNSDGGGIFTNTGGVTLVSSTVSGNQTNGTFSEGGGISTYSGNLLLINSTLSGNRTIGDLAYGAGVYSSSGNVAVTNSTVVGNTTSGGNANGGGIFAFEGGVSIGNSIVAGNVVDNGTAPDLRPGNSGTLTVSHSLIGNTSGSGVTASTGSGNILNQGASLGPLTDNGGLTLTHAPLTGSPVINAGNNGLAVNGMGGTLITDQRGGAFSRVESGTVDMGAVEVQAPTTALSIVSATINEGGVLARPDLWNKLTVVFDADTTVHAGDLSLFNNSQGGTLVDLSGVDFSYDTSTQTAVWDFSTRAPLEAGYYTYRLAGGISSTTGLLLDGNGDGVGGDAFLAEHYVAIPGDANLDGQVNVLGDAFSLVANLNSTSNLAWEDGNFNGDGTVNVLGDGFILVANLGRDVRPPSVASVVSAKFSDSGKLASPGGEGDSFVPVFNLSRDVRPLLSAKVFSGPQTLDSPSAESDLTLAGANDLRDDVFGSDF